MDYRDSSELQLLEVARGVRKLTQMIHSWSKAPNLDARSKYIAKDLLRDSLALQESLITIRRLQETSRMMSFMNQKHEAGFIKERRVDEEDNNGKECGSHRFELGIYDDIIHSLSTNGSSRNHANEMKSAIIGKLNKQNLVPIVNNHDIASSNRFIEFPTSRSFSLKENSKNMTDLARKAKAPNLIAKLMGLEKIPSQVVQSVKKEQEIAELKNIYKETLDYKNPRIQPCFTSVERTSHVNGNKDPTVMIMKPLQLLAHENKVEKQKKKGNLEAELSLKKEVSGDRHTSNRKKAVKRMDKASLETKLKIIASVSHKQQRKEPLAIGVNKGSILNVKAPEERRDAQVIVPLFQTKRIKESPAKPNKKITTPKGGAQAVCIQSSTSRKNISITNVKTMAKHSATYLMEEDKTKGEKMSGILKNIKTANTKCKGACKRTKHTKNASDLCSSFSASYSHGFPQKLLEVSKLSYGENTRMESKRFCEVMPKGSKGGKQRVSVKASMPPYDKPIALKEAAEPQTDAKRLLLTSSHFLTEAEELFGFDVQIYRAKSYQNNNFEEFGDINAYKLLLGCAVELIARKSYQIELLNHPMCGTYQKRSKVLISLEQLVEDVRNGMKELNGYYRNTDSKDNLYWRLERDLSCKNMFLNASWDFGWICWVCVEEIGAIVEQIGEHIMCGIVGEVAFDLVQ